jgi:hypothetical protein
MSTRQPNVKALRNPGFFWGAPLYELLEDWTFQVDYKGEKLEYFIPKGYKFDGASIPRLFWGFPFGYTPFGVHIGAALEHDWLCEWRPLDSATVHAHFEKRLREDGIRPSQAWAMGKAVKLFGPRF